MFFGDFTDLDYPTFRDELQEAIADEERAYELLIREVYTLGDYLLRKKYRFLRLAYLFFLVGVLTSGFFLGCQLFLSAEMASALFNLR